MVWKLKTTIKTTIETWVKLYSLRIKCEQHIYVQRVGLSSRVGLEQPQAVTYSPCISYIMTKENVQNNFLSSNPSYPSGAGSKV